jgi:hypothetical protein
VRAGAAGAAAARNREKQRKERGREEGEGGADMWDRLVSGTREKEKAARTRAAAGKGKVGWWATGPKGKVR